MKIIAFFTVLTVSLSVFAKGQLPEDFCTGLPQEIECTVTYLKNKNDGTNMELSPAEIFTLQYDTTMFCSKEEAVKGKDFTGTISVANGKYLTKFKADFNWLYMEIWDTTNGWSDPVSSGTFTPPYKDQYDILGSQNAILQYHLPDGGYVLAMCVNFGN